MPAEPSQTLVAPFTGTVVATPAAADQHVAAGAPVVVIEAMKMEHEIVAAQDAMVRTLNVEVGQTVEEGQAL
ncbi:MAG: acetyl-CoA carboxylase biotin carboxyl carrier protein subunit, partial [Solirubrobacteraceae bacterium]